MKTIRNFAMQVMSYVNKETVDSSAAMHTVTIGYAIFGATCTYIAAQATQFILHYAVANMDSNIAVQSAQLIGNLLF